MGREIIKIRYPLTRAVFEEFDRRVLDDLAKRKWINRHFRTNARYYAWLKDQEKIKNEKARDESYDRMTEGYMKMDRMERTKTFTY